MIVFLPNDSYFFFFELSSIESLKITFVGFFRIRKNFSTTNAIVSFFLFFFSRPLNENFKLLKNCSYDFHTIVHSHSTPLRAQRHQNRMIAMWETANSSPKMAKKVIFRLFFDFLKNSIRFERNFLQSFYAIIWSYECSFNKFVWLGFERVRRKKT